MHVCEITNSLKSDNKKFMVVLKKLVQKLVGHVEAWWNEHGKENKYDPTMCAMKWNNLFVSCLEMFLINKDKDLNRCSFPSEFVLQSLLLFFYFLFPFSLLRLLAWDNGEKLWRKTHNCFRKRKRVWSENDRKELKR